MKALAVEARHVGEGPFAVNVDGLRMNGSRQAGSPWVL